MSRLTALLIIVAITSLTHGQQITFPRGTWTTQTYAAYAGANNQTLLSATVGGGYCIFNNFSLNLEAIGYGILQEGPDTAAAGAQFIFRHHIFTRDRWTVFADVGESLFEAADDVPAGGTRFNFVFRSGLGMTYELKPDVHLLAGIRYFHLSNAQMEGSERNPSINGVEGYVGLLFTLH
jgi:hypothetical protein